MITEARRGTATTWTLKEPVESIEDLDKLASIPFSIDPQQIEQARRSYLEANQQYGRRAMLRTFLPSPIVCVSGCMPFELLLILSLTEKKLMHELCAEVTRRQLEILGRIFSGDVDSTVTFGGSEQCTPPMMPAEAYDEYVIPYDGQLIRFLKERDVLVQIHCHSRVRHALKCMVAMGVDATDPVEPPPAGDVTYAEARQIVGGKLALMGNIEWDRLENGRAEEIRAHVKEILSHGRRRLVLGVSAGPICAVSRRLVDNYKVLVDTALEFGS